MSLKATSDEWWKNAVVYCLDVETFFDSDGDGCGDLAGLTERVDYLGGLGVSCLWLIPFYPSPNRDDDYDIVDFYAVDRRMGTACASRDSPYRDFYVRHDSKPEEKPGIAQIMGFWLDLGLSGFRIDAVAFLIEPVGLPDGAIVDPHELLRDLRAYVNRRSGDAIQLGEVNLPADEGRRFLGDEDGDELHMLLDFLGNQALYLSLARGDAATLRRTLRGAPQIPDTTAMARFVRNHDELTLDKLDEDERAEVFARFGPDEGMQLYGRMAVRSPMQWAPERNGGFSQAEDPGALLRPLSDGAFGPQHVSVAAQRRDPGSLLNWFERLIRRRRETPAIGFGTLTLLDVDAPSVLAHRCDWEGSTIVAVHELAGEAVEVTVGVDDGEALIDLFSDAEHALPATLRLAGHGAHWFAVRRPGQRLAP